MSGPGRETEKIAKAPSLPPATRWLKRIGTALLGLILGTSLLELPAGVAGAGLDLSWQVSLGYFLKHRFQAGTDYIFTFGPLGYFYTAAYERDLFWYRYLWGMCLTGLMVLALLRIMGHIHSRLLRVAFFATLLICLPERTDSLYPFFIVLLAFLPLLEDRLSLAYLLPCAFLLAVLSLIKFNLFILSVASVSLLAIYLLAAQRGRTALGLVVAFLGFCLLTWIAAGQLLSGLPRYLQGSLEITNGFSEAMAIEGAPFEMCLAVAILILLPATVATYGPALVHDAKQLVVTALLALSVFLQWKHGFVRHDGHSMIFFAYVLLVPFLFPLLYKAHGPSPLRVCLLSAIMVLSLVGRYAASTEPANPAQFLTEHARDFIANGEYALFPWRLQDALESQRTEFQARWSMPAVQAEVKDSSVDLMSFEQGILLLNDLRYQPRPVFQSYAAYTPYLLHANSRFYQGEQAPDYVLLQIQTIDERVPALDDGLALLEILRRYRPVLEEKHYLLLKRSREPATEPFSPPSPPGGRGQDEGATVLLEKTCRFGEEVKIGDLPGVCQTVAIDIRYSLWGRARKFLYKSPPLYIQFAISDGRTETYRLIPAMAREGFLLNPLLERNADVQRLYRRQPGKRVTAFRLLCPEGGQQSYHDEIRITVRNLSDVPCP